MNTKEKDLKYTDDGKNTVYFDYVQKNVLAGKVPLFNYNKDIKRKCVKSINGIFP